MSNIGNGKSEAMKNFADDNGIGMIDIKLATVKDGEIEIVIDRDMKFNI